MQSKIITTVLIAIVGGTVSNAQISVAHWTFDGVDSGTTTSIAASSTASGFTVSALTEAGGVNTIGVVESTFGTVKAPGSDDFMGPSYSVAMNIPGDVLSAEAYSLNFNISPDAGTSVEFLNFVFDFGYDTNFATSQPNYFAPRAQLFVSTDGSNWTAASGELTPDIGGDESIFSTGAGSGGVHFIEAGITVDLAGTLTGTYVLGDTVHFRLALADPSGSDRRRHLIDNVAVTAVPEPAGMALALGLGALGGMLLRRRIVK